MRVRWFLGGDRPTASRNHRTTMEAAVAETVASRSGGDPHEVRCRNGYWSCSCLAYAKGGRECWAMKQIKASRLTQVK
jgi:hypothetical protein